jgi:hypothetical protein
MRRILLGLVAGFVIWISIGAFGFYLLRLFWHDYAAAEPDMNFSLPMQLARLAIGVACSIGGGWIAALAAKRNPKAAWTLGVLLLLLFIPVHYGLWNKFPIWFHLAFLLTLVPITGFSARLARERRK